MDKRSNGATGLWSSKSEMKGKFEVWVSEWESERDRESERDCEVKSDGEECEWEGKPNLSEVIHESGVICEC